MAAGTLDGLHKGHREVLETAMDRARVLDAHAMALTLDPHPTKILQPDRKDFLLNTLPHKLYLLEQLGLDNCLILPFSRELAGMEPETFLATLTGAIPHLRELVVGANWTFGRKAAGNVNLLRRKQEKYGFKPVVVSQILWKGEPISSTRIREAIKDGRLEDAELMLGRPFSIYGRIKRGRQVGRTLGYPTANIRIPTDTLAPLPGIYAVKVGIDAQLCDGAAYYGRRPTFEDDCHDLLLEVHLFTSQPDIYDKEIEVFFIQFLRGDRSFDSERELIEQIAKDCQLARTVLKRHGQANIMV